MLDNRPSLDCLSFPRVITLDYIKLGENTSVKGKGIYELQFDD